MNIRDVLQGILSIGLWGAVIYLALTAQPIPEVLVAGSSAIIGF